MEIKLQDIDGIVFCKRCHRRLKGEKSKMLGYGPSCYEKAKKQLKKNYLFKLEV